METQRQIWSGRAGSAAAVAAVHLLALLALLRGSGLPHEQIEGRRLTLVEVPQAIPPHRPPEAKPDPPRPRREQPEALAGAAASPVAAPVPEVELPTEQSLIAAPLPAQGSAASSGTAAAGAGTGSGAGGEGSGGGGNGGGFTRARLIEGRLVDRDYPRSAAQAGAGGTVIVRFAVGVDGRASGCRVTRSSGHAELDATTCRLIEERFRYAPARDAEGRAVTDVMGWKQEWWLERRGD